LAEVLGDVPAVRDQEYIQYSSNGRKITVVTGNWHLWAEMVS